MAYGCRTYFLSRWPRMEIFTASFSLENIWCGSIGFLCIRGIERISSIPSEMLKLAKSVIAATDVTGYFYPSRSRAEGCVRRGQVDWPLRSLSPSHIRGGMNGCLLCSREGCPIRGGQDHCLPHSQRSGFLHSVFTDSCFRVRGKQFLVF